MKRSFLLILLLSFVLSFCMSFQAQAASDADWQALAKYEHGQDIKLLLKIDRAVADAMRSPETRKACAERLATLLEASETTLASKQYICLKLRLAGTSAQVPTLTKMLGDPKTTEMARMALERIPGDASLKALQDGLKTVKGKQLLGLIGSLGARKDASSVALLKEFVSSEDADVADTTIQALSRIGGPEVAAILAEKVAKSTTPIPTNLAAAYLKTAWQLAENGKPDEAKAIFQRMSEPGETVQNRQNAMLGLLNLSGDKTMDTILAWLADADPLKRQVAADKLSTTELDEAKTKIFLEKLPQLPTAGKSLLIEILAAKQVVAARPAAIAAAKSDEPTLKLAAIRALGTIGDTESVPLLIDAYINKTPYANAAEASLIAMPGRAVDQTLLATVKTTENSRESAQLIEILTKRKAQVSVSDFLAEAANQDAAVHTPAITALRELASPNDVSLLIDLLPSISDRKHRDEIEKTILLVCKKIDRKKDPAEKVLNLFAKADASKQCTLLPLLGRLGGKKSLDVITSSMKSENAEVQDAAVRALCNWPDASVADQLLDLAKTSDNRSYRIWALRAYIRVVSLKNKRPDAETLAMLQNAFKISETDSERRLALQRAANVRTIETLRWVVPHLDNPALDQTACQTVLDLAHHRFLRTPNKAEFTSALEKVSKVSKDSGMIEQAKQHLLGL